ncbi:hypothetical protein ANABIO32_02240 [Rossellomorea marisflavi]|uniref:hypothetical protein n=1 Tax=Rossellomorea marisflavi TaxID=189381 RepID=UPI0025CA1352|nr:hypothetical protein [Rossellomorea marisflavi]GLI82537.1 hypothetical protein ANABIO32_02240 [Rossellomorea marisflavi]
MVKGIHSAPGKQLTLKEYKEMEEDRIYKLDDQYFVFDGNKLLTNYPGAWFWEPIYETNEDFISQRDKVMIKTNEVMA